MKLNSKISYSKMFILTILGSIAVTTHTAQQRKRKASARPTNSTRFKTVILPSSTSATSATKETPFAKEEEKEENTFVAANSGKTGANPLRELKPITENGF